MIHPTVDATTRTFVTEINIPNTDSRIRPGMFARVNIDFGDVDRVVVPDQAVVKRSGSGDRFVYVYKDGKVSFNQVQLGRHMDKTYELISSGKWSRSRDRRSISIERWGLCENCRMILRYLIN